MNTEKELLQIMDQVDGYALKETDGDLKEEIMALQQCASALKELPFQEVPADADDRFRKFMESISETSKTSNTKRLRTLVVISTIAAGLALFLMFNPAENIEVLESFSALNSNPDKLSYVYDLNSKKLGNKELEEVKLLLALEQNPNLSVAMLDLLSNYSPENLDSEELFLNLNKSSIPSVQMAMLNTMEATDISTIRLDLDKFMNTAGLEETVKNKIQEMLNNTNSKNLK